MSLALHFSLAWSFLCWHVLLRTRNLIKSMYHLFSQREWKTHAFRTNDQQHKSKRKTFQFIKLHQWTVSTVDSVDGGHHRSDSYCPHTGFPVLTYVWNAVMKNEILPIVFIYWNLYFNFIAHSMKKQNFVHKVFISVHISFHYIRFMLRKLNGILSSNIDQNSFISSFLVKDWIKFLKKIKVFFKYFETKNWLKSV